MNRFHPTAEAPLDIIAIEAEARRLRAETLSVMARDAGATIRRLWRPIVAQKAR